MIKRIFVVLLAGAMFTGWVIYPGLPRPDELVGLTYGELVQRLGEPDFEAPGKFVVWSSERIVGNWGLEAGFDTPPKSGVRPVLMHRELYMGFGPFRKAFFVSVATAGKS